MIIVRNKLIPFPGYKMINIFGILFIKGEGKTITELDVRHENIHTKQMLELLFIGYYLWYVIEYIVRLFINKGEAYKSISFEREAYINDDNINYLKERKLYAWVKYLRQDLNKPHPIKENEPNT